LKIAIFLVGVGALAWGFLTADWFKIVIAFILIFAGALIK